MRHKPSLPSPAVALVALLLAATLIRVTLDFANATGARAIGRSPLDSGVAPAPGRERIRIPGSRVVLAEGGVPRAKIIITPDSSGAIRPADRAAAELLQEWSELLIGAAWQIEDEPGDFVPIYVGTAAIEAGLALDDISSRSREGLRVRIESDRVLLAGQNRDATLKAAATFLEELGCRWYMEGDLGRHCPRPAMLQTDPVAITDRPGFLYRRIWGAEGWSRPTSWKVWNGAGGMALRMGHAWSEIKSEDFTQHPDWFAMDARGERVDGPWLNTGNPQLREAFAARLIESMVSGEHPSISPPDSHRTDFSPDSRRYDDPTLIEPSSGSVSMSNRFMHFANEVADRVAGAHPDSILGFYAYSDYSQPPTIIDRLHPNLCIWIAPIRYSRFHRLGAPNSPSRQQLVEVIAGWSEVASMLGYRTYNYNLAESITPFAKLTTWTHDIPYLARHNFVGMSIESFPTWDLSAPTIYLSLRLAYSPLADAAAILDDFYTGFYGPGAAPMREYWETVDDAWQSLTTESGSIYSVHLVFTPERLRELDAALTRAAGAVGGDAARVARVAMARIGFQHAVDFVAVRQALHTGDVKRAERVFRDWESRTRESIEAGTGHRYNLTYLERFVGRTVAAATAALNPAEGSNRTLAAVLPDTMLLAYESDLATAGAQTEPLAARVSDRRWQTVRTYSATLDQQGLSDRLEIMWYRTELDLRPKADHEYTLFFAAIDGTSDVWINGAVATEPPETTSGASVPALRPFLLDVTSLLRTGANRVAVRIDHRVIRELRLGGIVGPVYLLERPAS